MAKRLASSPRAARIVKNGSRTSEPRIDYSDLPQSTPEQLRAMRRVGRPLLGEIARQLIAIRVDPHVLERLRREAKRRNIGYQTLVNRVLAEHVGLPVA
jgi:uncharacterized protein (DUF4415 family)